MTNMERPDADALEQQREQVQTDELEPIEEIPAETNESDFVEQRRVVPVDDDE